VVEQQCSGTEKCAVGTKNGASGLTCE
jgi:hypothetical protein